MISVTRNRTATIVVALGAILCLMFAFAGRASADHGELVQAEDGTNSNVNGAQTVSWSSAFKNERYHVGDTLRVTVSWTVDCGATGFNVSRGVTPRGGGFSPGTVTGTAPRVISWTANSATFDFEFTNLHKPGNKPNGKGNAQFLVHVLTDQDCFGGTDGSAALGVNVHVLTAPDQS